MTGYYAKGKYKKEQAFKVAEQIVNYEILEERELKDGITKRDQKAYKYADAKEINEQISLPSAFEFYRNIVFSIAKFSS